MVFSIAGNTKADQSQPPPHASSSTPPCARPITVNTPNATSRCFDRNANGKIDSDECVGDYNFTFEIPREATKAAAPFKWVALNWNPHGHGSPAPPPWGRGDTGAPW